MRPAKRSRSSRSSSSSPQPPQAQPPPSPSPSQSLPLPSQVVVVQQQQDGQDEQDEQEQFTSSSNEMTDVLPADTATARDDDDDDDDVVGVAADASSSSYSSSPSFSFSSTPRPSDRSTTTTLSPSTRKGKEKEKQTTTSSSSSSSSEKIRATIHSSMSPTRRVAGLDGKNGDGDGTGDGTGEASGAAPLASTSASSLPSSSTPIASSPPPRSSGTQRVSQRSPSTERQEGSPSPIKSPSATSPISTVLLGNEGSPSAYTSTSPPSTSSAQLQTVAHLATSPPSPRSPTAKRIGQVMRRSSSNEGSPVRTIGGAVVAPTSPGERSTDQQQQHKPPPIASGSPSAPDLAGQRVEDERGVKEPELVGELSAVPTTSSIPSEAEEGEEIDVILSHGGQQVSVKIPQPLLLTSTIARGHFHQCGTARRVKVYRLEGDSWTDNGTGYCAGVYDEVHDEALLVARVEESSITIEGAAPDPRKQLVADGQRADPTLGDPAAEAEDFNGQASQGIQPYHLIVSEDMDVDEHIMLNSQVVKDDVYGKQQDTLVVWTEPDGTDMALSFQEADGCQEVWEFITEVQRHFHANQAAASATTLSDSPPPDPGSPTSCGDLSQSKWGMGMVMLIDSASFNPPEPSLGKLDEIEHILKETASKGPLAREKVAEWLVRADYLRQLVPVFQDAEDLENLEGLHSLCTIMQTIVMLNDSAIIETIIQDDLFIEIAGMFEYDPEFPSLKASYRDYLRHTAKFKMVVDIDDIKIVTKIHQVYRLQYLKDVILARILDDAMFSVLNSWIFFHQVDIVNYCSSNVFFLQRVIAVCAPDSKERRQRKHDAVFLLQSLCTMGKQVQMPVRVGLYRALTENGIFSLLEYGLFESSKQRVRNAAAEMLMVLVEFDSGVIRSYILDQEDDQEKTLVERLTDLLHSAKDLGFKAQVAETLRAIFDSPSSQDTANQSLNGNHITASARDKSDPDRFLANLYEVDIDRLFKPLRRLPDYKTLDISTVRYSLGSREQSALLAHLCELLCNCIVQHGFRSQYFVITSEITMYIATLLFAKEKHLKLAAIKLFRACLASNNQFINRHFLKHDIFGAMLVLARRECQRDNLILSACIEFFEHLKKDKCKAVMEHLAEHHYEDLQVLAHNRFAEKSFASILEMARGPPSLFPSEDDGKGEGTEERGEGGGSGNISSSAGPSGPKDRGGVRGSSKTASSGTVPSLRRRGKRSVSDVSKRNSASAFGRIGASMMEEEGEDEENAYFDGSDDEDDSLESGAAPSKPSGKASSASHSSSKVVSLGSDKRAGSSGLAGIGMYSDDEEGEDEDDVVVEGNKKEEGADEKNSTSASTLTATVTGATEGSSIAQPPNLQLSRGSEKRRREEVEEEEQEISGFERLAKRSHAAASTSSDPTKVNAKEALFSKIGQTSDHPALADGNASSSPIGRGGGFLLEEDDHDAGGEGGKESESERGPSSLLSSSKGSTQVNSKLKRGANEIDDDDDEAEEEEEQSTGVGGMGMGTGTDTKTGATRVMTKTKTKGKTKTKKISLGLSSEARQRIIDADLAASAPATVAATDQGKGDESASGNEIASGSANANEEQELK